MSVVLQDSSLQTCKTEQRHVAVFDLDGTLVRGDTFVPFLASFAWRRRRLLPLFVLPFYVFLYVIRLASARTAKERLLRTFFRGEQLEAITQHAESFCATWVKKRLRPNVVERLSSHQASDDRVILLSASPDLYVQSIGRYLGISEVIATQVASADGICLGFIKGANCKGAEKIEALKRHLACDEPPNNSVAYGDSKSDIPLLQWVNRGFLVARGKLTAVSCDQESQS